MKITVFGAGSWGTTIAILLASKGYQVSLWEHYKEHVDLLNKHRENIKFLPGVFIPEGIAITNSLEECLQETECMVVVVPSHAVRSVLKRCSPLIKKGTVIVSAAKGLEQDTLSTVSQIIESELPAEIIEDIGVLSGPSHAEEVSRYVPTTVVSAAKQEKTARFIQELFSTPYFRVYTNLDVKGVELGGSLKNIIALASGILCGLGFGDNTNAALITRGLAEISRLGVAMGAQRETFFGLSGIGDLVVTCTSKHSRNRYLGELIGKGMSLNEALASMTMVAEGVNTTKAAFILSKKLGVELPITTAIHDVLFEGMNPQKAVEGLMTRELKSEW
ncbi:NAD(P)H-dependent glycerol-3-phosphate dehydrogenase [bacterium]|nr:NAD(P)H-dependent glycerol-3-phosphate dehydrogenase [bacterium]MBU1753964.1 NAD(P)H-dependent glycerol-3-phosphate dehydrogenase [bacterium]